MNSTCDDLLGPLELKIKILDGPDGSCYHPKYGHVKFEFALLDLGTPRALIFIGALLSSKQKS